MTPPDLPTEPAAPPGSRLRGCRVLLVEDSPPDIYVYKTALARAGAEVTVVSDGRLAVGAVEAGLPFHVVVVDQKQPGMRGTEVAASIRSRGFGGKVVGLSGFMTRELAEMWLAAGCDAVAEKANDSIAAFLRTATELCGRCQPA